MQTPSDVDLAAMKHPPTTFVHDLASRLRCRKMRQGGPPSRSDPATIGLAAASASNRNLKNVQSLLDHDQPGSHHRPVSRGQPIRRQTCAHAGRVPGLQGADRAQRSRGRELATSLTILFNLYFTVATAPTLFT